MYLDDDARTGVEKLVDATRDLPSGPERARNLRELQRILPGSEIENLLDSDYPSREIVELCLRADTPPVRLSREDLLELVRRIMEGEVASDVDLNLMVETFNRNCRHPAGSDLIFYPDSVFGPAVQPTAEEIVALALEG